MKQYFRIDHRILFLIGYVFYLFTPLIVGYFNFFDGYPGIELYQGFFKQISENKIITYLLITLSWLPAFYIGHFIFKLCKPYKRSLQLFSKNSDSSNMPLIAVVLFLVLVIFVLLGRGSLFGGYATYDANVRGKFSTLLVIYDFFLVYQLITKQKISILLIAGCTLTAFFLLTMGGRMYVFQTFLTLLVFKTSFARKKWNLKQIGFILAVGLFVGSALGVWRQNLTFNLSKASYSFFAEPVFTWFSTSTFLIDNKIPLVNFPANFLTSFFNLVPNTFFSLRQYVISTQDMGFITQSPLGADSVWSTFVINFGSIGSFFFMMATGFVLNFLRHNSENSRFGAVYYIMVCGLLPFQFFRDGFYIINKQLFFNFLLLPGLIFLVLRFVQYSPIKNQP